MSEKKTKWSDIPPADKFENISVAGRYNVLVKEAWDSLMAPPGTYDGDREEKKHYVGLNCMVVDEKSEQNGHYVRIKLWAHTDKSQRGTRAVFDMLNMDIEGDIGPDDPLSVSEMIGQYLNVIVSMRPDQENPQIEYPDVKPWDIYEPEAVFVNQKRQLYADAENKVSVEFYQRELNRKKDQANLASGAVDDDLPF
jgi:hypothetical protein